MKPVKIRDYRVTVSGVSRKSELAGIKVESADFRARNRFGGHPTSTDGLSVLSGRENAGSGARHTEKRKDEFSCCALFPEIPRQGEPEVSL